MLELEKLVLLGVARHKEFERTTEIIFLIEILKAK